MKFRHIIAVAMCCALALLMMPPGVASAHVTHKFSGKQIFEGVFFNIGPVAKELPEMWGDPTMKNISAATRSTRFQKAVSALESRLVKRDPHFYSDLQRDMTSGDPGRVQLALTRTRSEVSAAIRVSSSPTRVAVLPDTVNVVQGVNAVDTVVAVVGVDVAVVVVVLALVVLLDTPQTTAFSEQSGVAFLTTRLSEAR